MIHIDEATSKKDLLNALAEVAENSGTLYLNVHSLPTFLVTPIAFTVFNYQISNYPRSVVWTSEDEEVLDFLRSCHVRTISPEKLQKIESRSQHPVEEKDGGQNENQIVEAEPVEEEPRQQKKVNAENLLSESEYRPSSLIQNSLLTEKMEVREDESETDTASSNSESTGFESSGEEAAAGFGENTEQVYASQNLDDWLDRIEQTRSSLHNLRNQKSKIFTEDKVSRGSVWNIGFVSLLLSMLVFGFIFLFPTKVYTVQVSPSQKTVQTNLEVPKFNFQKESLTLSSKQSVELQTNKKETIDKARGKVRITNFSGGDIRFNEGQIYLISPEGERYVHLAQSSEPNVIRVPAGGSVEIQVQASNAGERYNLEKGGKFQEITNLQGDTLGDSLEVKAITEITNVVTSSQKIVTKEDKKRLKEQIKQEFEEQKQNFLENLEAQFVTSSKWFKPYEIEYDFSHEVGEIAQKLEVTGVAQADLLVLTKDTLSNYIEQEVEDFERLVSYEMQSTATKVREISKQENLSLELKVDYIPEAKLDRKEVSRIVKESDNFQVAKKRIKEKYPYIKEIQQTEQGIEFPGLNSRLDVRIEE